MFVIIRELWKTIWSADGAISGGKEISMVLESRTRVLVEKIDDAIEQAEDLGLSLVVGILMMARLETVQTEQLAVVGSANGQLS
jgi:hypothetical protein